MGNSRAELPEIMRRVAERALDWDYSVWFWGDAIVMDGLLDASELLGDEALADGVRKHVNRWVRRVQENGPSWADHMTPGSAVIRVANKDGDPAALEAARALAGFLENGPRSRWLDAPLRHPDSPAHRNYVWIDNIYHEGTFFYRLGLETGEERYFDVGRHCLESRIAVLLHGSQTGLFAQVADTARRRMLGEGWGRGQGWALLGLVDSLELLPPARPEHARIADVVRDVSTRLLPFQDSTGFWRTIVQSREAYLETSTAAFYASVFYKGVRLGVFDPEDVRRSADDAFAALLTRIDEEGRAFGVSGVSWPDEHDPRYLLRKPTEFNAWGQGAALRALSERLRLDSAP